MSDSVIFVISFLLFFMVFPVYLTAYSDPVDIFIVSPETFPALAYFADLSPAGFTPSIHRKFKEYLSLPTPGADPKYHSMGFSLFKR